MIEQKLSLVPEAKVKLLNVRGDELPPTGNLDIIVSLGVVHHIPEPEPVIKAAFHALKPGGKLIIWLYGYEGNEAYLAVAEPLRKLTRQLPHGPLNALAWMLNVPLTLYLWICQMFPRDRVVTIYDQLNPHYAKYYKREEAWALMASMPFEVAIRHRHGYGWTVIGTKPARLRS